MGRAAGPVNLEGHARVGKYSGYMIIEGQAIFDLYATHGLPLAEALTMAREGGFALDIPGFIKKARMEGWSEEKVQATMREAYGDGLGYQDGSLRLVEALTKQSYWNHS